MRDDSRRRSVQRSGGNSRRIGRCDRLADKTGRSDLLPDPCGHDTGSGNSGTEDDLRPEVGGPVGADGPRGAARMTEMALVPRAEMALVPRVRSLPMATRLARPWVHSRQFPVGAVAAVLAGLLIVAAAALWFGPIAAGGRLRAPAQAARHPWPVASGTAVVAIPSVGPTTVPTVGPTTVPTTPPLTARSGTIGASGGTPASGTPGQGSQSAPCPPGTKANFRWHYSANGSPGAWSGQKSIICPGSLSMGPQAMEGDLKVSPGVTLKVGYDFAVPGNKASLSLTVNNPQVVLTVRCVSGASPSQSTETVSMPSQTYTVTNDQWIPSGDQKSPLGYPASITVPDLCGGGQLRLDQGGTFTANVS